ncbi:uncharacterized protein LOC129305546 [Prosopis cineraria]|uniref:uncharacterized protein LOC129300238 n=1 Tax=Prosopis cineraria TaxID=364024 RepID=UPI0024106A90|nr:uncharacterized protein LOC129300238 [Prosopis cineraria]XP_054801520.1 uncharacterized protein LOC129305546 [Prosopis cineraria]
MASALPKLLTRSSVTRIVSAFQLHNSYAPTFLEPLASRPSPLVGINPEFHQPATLNPGKEHPALSTVIFPSFPFGFPVNPVSSTGCCSTESVDAEMDDSRTMWADSVKKKRKKKMNKHKYQKLRKRMRRQH